MTHLGYLLAGWGVTLGALGLYAFRLSVRGRALAARVPVDRRRWMTAEEES
ncbi:MAG: hypothetical protein AAGE98_19185 [Actinomycetota bacterium]